MNNVWLIVYEESRKRCTKCSRESIISLIRTVSKFYCSTIRHHLEDLCPLFREKYLSSRNLCSFVFDTPRDNEAPLICAPGQKETRAAGVSRFISIFQWNRRSLCLSTRVTARNAEHPLPVLTEEPFTRLSTFCHTFFLSFLCAFNDSNWGT